MRSIVEGRYDRSPLKGLARRLAVYWIVNGISVPSNLVLAWFLYEKLNVHYLVATTAGFLVQVFICAVLNLHYTFKESPLRLKQVIARALGADILSLLLILAVTKSGVQVFMLEFIYARMLALVLIGPATIKFEAMAYKVSLWK